MNDRNAMLAKLDIEGLEELSLTIRRSLEFADKTASVLREWLGEVEAAIERKAGF